MAGLNHQASGALDCASAARCPDRALLSKHSNQNEKPDLGQEGDAHDRDHKEHVARREMVHGTSRLPKPLGVNHSGEKMFRFQTQSARDASGAGIRGGLRRSPIRVKLGKAHSEHMMSAVHPIADSTRTSFHVRNVPTADIDADPPIGSYVEQADQPVYAV